MNKYATQSPSSREVSARTCLIVAGVLLIVGIVVINPTAGVLAFVLAALLALIGICLGFRRYGVAGIILLLIAVALIAWRLPDAQEDYGRYLEKVQQKSSQ